MFKFIIDFFMSLFFPKKMVKIDIPIEMKIHT